MRIILVSSDFPPDPGGIASHVYYLGKYLALAGHSVALVHNAKSRDVHHEYRLTARAIGLDYIPLSPVSRRWRVLRSIERSLNTASSIRRAFTRDDATVVHFHDLMHTTTASALVPGHRVWTNHSSQFYELRGFRLAATWLFTRVNSIIAPSSELAEMTRRRLHREARFIANGVELEAFADAGRARQDSCEFRIVVPRRMVHKNGIDVLMRAASLLEAPKRHTSWRLLIPETGATEGYRDEVLELSRLAPPHVNVSLLGEVGHDQMARYYFASDIAVIPSRIEAVSISALEAIAAQLPLIASSVGGLQDAFQGCEAVSLVPPDDPAALAVALTRIESLPAPALSKIAEAASKWVSERFTWAAIVNETVDAYSTVGR